MKKILIVICSVFLFACSKSSNALKEITKNINNSNSYYLEGTLEVMNGDDSSFYNVKVSYKKDNLFKVSLTNQINNHEQIILRNTDGVYVLTPSIGKSFKFQSDWPYNNSQIYLLQTLLNDINNNEYTYKETNDEYTYTTNVTYSNDKNLVKQDIIFGKDYKIKSVLVYDKNESIKMKMIFKTVDMNKNYDSSYFTLEENMKSSKTEESTANLKDIVYPMYVPSDTYLTNKETIDTSNGKRVILTFTGNKPFTFIQENVSLTNVTLLIDGDFVLLNDVIGNVSENEVSWISNGIEYYITSDVLSKQEMIEIASSVGLLAVSK